MVEDKDCGASSDCLITEKYEQEDADLIDEMTTMPFPRRQEYVREWREKIWNKFHPNVTDVTIKIDRTLTLKEDTVHGCYIHYKNKHGDLITEQYVPDSNQSQFLRLGVIRVCNECKTALLLTLMEEYSIDRRTSRYVKKIIEALL
jgi:hypothetical protein